MKYVIQISYNGLHRPAGCWQRWFLDVVIQKEKPQGFKQVVTVSEKRREPTQAADFISISRKVTGGPCKHILMSHACDFFVSYTRSDYITNQEK